MKCRSFGEKQRIAAVKCRSFGEKQRIAAIKCRGFGEKQRIAAIKCREVWRETKKRYDKGLVRCAGNIN